MKQSSLQPPTPQSQGGNKQQGGGKHCERVPGGASGIRTRDSPRREGEKKVGQTEGRESLEDACTPETTLSVPRKRDGAGLSETQHTRVHATARGHAHQEGAVGGARRGCWEEGGVCCPSRPGFTLRWDHTSPAGRPVHSSGWST